MISEWTNTGVLRTMNLTECVITSVRWLTPFRKAEKSTYVGIYEAVILMIKEFPQKIIQIFEIDFWSNYGIMRRNEAPKDLRSSMWILSICMEIQEGIKRDVVNVEHIFNNWTPVTFSSSGTVQPADPNLLGAKTAMWADIADMGVTERDNYERLMRQAAVLSEKTWGRNG